MHLSNENRKALAGFFFGLSVASLIGMRYVDRAQNKVDERYNKIVRRQKMFVEAFGKMEEIASDVSLSGSEREKKIQEIQDFLETVVNEDPI